MVGGAGGAVEGEAGMRRCKCRSEAVARGSGEEGVGGEAEEAEGEAAEAAEGEGGELTGAGVAGTDKAGIAVAEEGVISAATCGCVVEEAMNVLYSTSSATITAAQRRCECDVAYDRGED